MRLQLWLRRRCRRRAAAPKVAASVSSVSAAALVASISGGISCGSLMPGRPSWASPACGTRRFAAAAAAHLGHGSDGLGFDCHPLIAEVLQHFRPPPAGAAGGARLVDIGCGDGAITRSMGRLPGLRQVLGVDLQQELISDAKTAGFMKLAAQESAVGCRVDFARGDAIDVDFFRKLSADGRVRCLTCFTTLHWLKEPEYAQELAVLNFARALAPGGQLLMVHFLGLDDAFLQLETEILGDFMGPDRKLESGSAYTPRFGTVAFEERLQHFQCLFEVAGLETEETRLAKDTFPLHHSQVTNFLTEASRHVKDLPIDLRTAYIERWVALILMRGKAAQVDGHLEFEARAIVAALRKEDDIPEFFL